jgi:hypothetical protein
MLIKRTLNEPDLNKALRFVLNYLEGLKVFEHIDQCEIISLIALHDRRFSEGQTKEIIFLDTNKFNSNGTLYITQSKALDAKNEGYKGILYLIKKVI